MPTMDDIFLSPISVVTHITYPLRKDVRDAFCSTVWRLANAMSDREIERAFTA